MSSHDDNPVDKIREGIMYLKNFIVYRSCWFIILESEINSDTIGARQRIAAERFRVDVVVKRRDGEKVSSLKSHVKSGDAGFAKHLPGETVAYGKSFQTHEITLFQPEVASLAVVVGA